MTIAITSTSSNATISVNGTDSIRFSTYKGLEVFSGGNWIDVQMDNDVYNELAVFVGQTTYYGNDTALIFDTSGNLYWAVMNYYNGTTYNLTSYVYKITPNGELTTFASQATIGGFGTDLVFDTSGNLYWSVGNYSDGVNNNQTSYVYKITPDGTKTTFASQATNGTLGSALIFGVDGYLYWAVMNNYSSSNYNQISYVYKIDPAGTKTIFASQAAAGGRDTALAFDTSGNLYWSFINFYDGTTYNKICYVYKITPDGTKTTFASQLATGGLGTDLIFDIAGTLYWALGNFGNNSVYAQTSYVYKITPDGTKTNFASCKTDGAGRTALAFDSSSNLYWSVTNYGNATARNATSFIFKINQSGTKTTFASQSGFGTASSTLVFGGNNLYWALMNYGESTSPCQNSYIYVKSL